MSRKYFYYFETNYLFLFDLTKTKDEKKVYIRKYILILITIMI